MQGALKGMTVAFANTVVVALMIASQQYHPNIDVAITVVVLGFIPAVLAGAFVGYLAAALVRVHRGLLVVAMCGFAWLCIIELAEEYSASEYVDLACLPTVFACVLLERWTRLRRIVREISPNTPAATCFH